MLWHSACGVQIACTSSARAMCAGSAEAHKLLYLPADTGMAVVAYTPEPEGSSQSQQPEEIPGVGLR